MAKEDTAFEPAYEVAIIGAGFSGSLTAIQLLAVVGEGQPPASVALIEKEILADGRRLRADRVVLAREETFHAAGERLLRRRARA